jgi:trans-2-enoyl-CoA reductase
LKTQREAETKLYLLADQVQKLRLAESALQKDLQTEAENLSKQVSSSNDELRNYEETHLTKMENL